MGINNSNFKAVQSALWSGATIPVALLGDSTIEGSGSGGNVHAFRLKLKQILAAWGMNIHYVGTLSTQNTNLDKLLGGNDKHNGVGGNTIAQIDARAAAVLAGTSMDAQPALTISGNFSNNAGVTNAAQTVTALQSLIDKRVSYNPGMPWLIYTYHNNNNSGSLYTDGAITPVILGTKKACMSRDDVVCVDEQAAMAGTFNQDAYIDSTHFSLIGNYREALRIAQVLAGARRPVIPAVPTDEEIFTAVASDKIYETGALLKATGGTFAVTTWDGRRVTWVFPPVAGTSGGYAASATSGTIICAVRSSGTTIGTNTAQALIFPIGALN